ncbi:MAG TPA: class I SAM-dependent methyltransferase [Acetobacteraceae bacterium]|jgi:SAM-dependent methyltransferase|nr:class I SAM-dependent methyltransferase [Acetobacteraceae bacterium]
MAQWDDGYVTDVAYTSNFYREITPSWIALTSLLLGHRPPDLAAPFTYADLGCGNGFTSLIIAAACPHAEVWGFDFNPAHVEFANGLAARAGLTNVRFVETSFADLEAASNRELRDFDMPDFDMMVSHGVLSWISPANREHLVGAVAKRLKPGGLVYLSYNVTTGWTGMVPVRVLMRMLTVASPERTDLAVPGVLDFVDRLKQAGASFFTANPALENRLTDIRKQDARYIAHEYLNHDWHPLMFTEVAGAMLEAKCRYIGSATLAENIDTVSVPPNVVPILAETRDPYLRETLRDLGCTQTFRRDLYRKGIAPIPAAEQQMLLEDLTLAGMGMAVPEGGITFATPIGNVTGRPEVYEPLLTMLEAGALSVREARAAPAFAGRALVELMQALTLLVAGGYAHPMLPSDGAAGRHEAARRLNLAIARANANAGDLPRLAAPAIGSAIGADILETLLVGELLAGQPADVGGLAARLVELLGRSGRSVQRDGKPVSDPSETMQIVTEAVVGLLERRVPLLRRLGVLEG